MNIKKRLLAIAAMIIGGGLLATSSAFALVTPPIPPALYCQQIVAGTDPWPEGKHSYYCDGATLADGTAVLGVLNQFTNQGKSNAEMVNLAGNTNRGNFYVFGNKTQYLAAFGNTYGVPSNGSAAFTANVPGTNEPIFSVVFVNNTGTPTPNAFIKNAAAHELGHWLDAVAGAGITGVEKISLGGTITVGHQISITVTNGTVSGGSATVSATSVAGDTLTTMSTKLAAAVNASVPLTSKGFVAAAAAESFTITYNAANPSGPVYSYAITGGGTITEEVWLDTGTKVSSTSLFAHAVHGSPAGANGDIRDFNLLGACTNSGVFLEQVDSANKFICATKTLASVTGNPAVGNILTIQFSNDDELPGGASVAITVAAGDTKTIISTKFAAAINANAALASARITATSNATTIHIVSASGNETAYAFNPGGGLGTMAFFNQGDGSENLLTKRYDSLKSNWQNLTETAWVDFYIPDKEIFAEKFAAQFGGTTDRAFPGVGPNLQSLDWYLQRNPNTFKCSDNIIGRAGVRLPPTAFPAGCPVN